MDIREIAKHYRATTGRTNGLILIYQGKAYGWRDCLRDPQTERPKAIAVDPEGRLFVATGGDDYQGAESWYPLY